MVDATIVKLTAMAKAQKRGLKAKHRPLERRHDHQNPGAHRYARPQAQGV